MHKGGPSTFSQKMTRINCQGDFGQPDKQHQTTSYLSLMNGSDKQFKALFDHATEGMLVCDERGKIILANPAAVRLFGYETGEMDDLAIEALVPRRLAQKHEKHREAYNNNPHSRSMGSNLDLYAVRKDGSEFPVEVSLSHYEINNNKFVIAFIVDISLRKAYKEALMREKEHLEKMVAERTQELEQTKNDIYAALEKEKELGDMKSRFVSMASHEFRTPLTAILSSASLIQTYADRNDSFNIQKHAARIKHTVDNLNNILSEFLSLGKLEEGKTMANPKEVNLRELIEDVYFQLKGVFKTGQNLQYDHYGQENVYIDGVLLKNVLINLISNASKYSGEEKIIYVQSKVEERKVVVTVRDEGIGISEEDQKQLFSRFFRAGNAANIQGTGLGLYIVKRYVEMMHGSIGFRSELGKGSEFWIQAPIHTP